MHRLIARWAVLAVITLASCAGPARQAPSAREATVVDAREPTEIESTDTEAAATPPEPAPEVVVATPVLRDIDSAGTPCFGDPAATPHSLGDPFQHPEGRFRTTIRSSARLVDDLIPARPGDVVRFDVTIENVGDRALALSEQDVARLQRVHVMGPYARWQLPIEMPGEPLRAGDALAPGAGIRLCLAFDVGRAPLTAGPASDRGERAYTIDWPSFWHQGLGDSGRYLATGRQVISVHHPRARGPVVRERESWGGVIVLELAEGASLPTIARETGVEIGSAAPLFVGRGAGGGDAEVGGDADAPARELVSAPPQRRVRDVAALLEARADVIRATPIMQGDAGTEGCSEHSPCARGEQCCYMCGIAGCPNSCYRGRSCPRGIP